MAKRTADPGAQRPIIPGDKRQLKRRPDKSKSAHQHQVYLPEGANQGPLVHRETLSPSSTRPVRVLGPHSHPIASAIQRFSR